MPAELHRGGFPAIAASAVNALSAVALDVNTARGVVPCATRNVRPFGIALASAPNVGDGLAVLDEGNTVTVTAIASLGAGAEIGVASSNGALGPIVGASGVVSYSVGQSVSPANAAEDFSLYVNPRQLGGLA